MRIEYRDQRSEIREQRTESRGQRAEPPANASPALYLLFFTIFLKNK